MLFHESSLGELSCKHITREDAVLLKDNAAKVFMDLVVAQFDTGWFVEVGAAPGHECAGDINHCISSCFEAREFSKQFQTIVLDAQKAGLQFLRIHRDCDEVAGFETFEWEI